MLEIGLTGGIGSGKSTVAREFASRGYPIYYADDRAKLLYDEDAELKAAVTALLAPTIVYDESGRLMRQALAARIFSDKELLAKINALVHPAVRRDYANWVAGHVAEGKVSIVLREAAILFEAGAHTLTEGVIAVYAPKHLRIQRVCQRDQVTVEQVLARMAQQWPDAQKMARADFIIFNDGRHALAPQIDRAIQWMHTL